MGFSGNMILAANVSPFEDTLLFSQAKRLISAQRLEKTERYRFEKDKRLSVGAEILLAYTFKQLGYDFSKLEFTTKKNSKPCIKNENDIFFNISHSGEYVMCAVSDRDVGCDIEKITEFKPRVAEKILTGNEKLLLNSTEDSTKKTDMFFRFWTLKESYVKYTGQGFALSPTSFEICLDENISVKQNDIMQSCNFREFYIPGYKCSVCGESNFSDTELIIADIVKLTASLS